MRIGSHRIESNRWAEKAEHRKYCRPCRNTSTVQSRGHSTYPIGEQQSAEAELSVFVDDLLRVLYELRRVAARVCAHPTHYCTLYIDLTSTFTVQCMYMLRVSRGKEKRMRRRRSEKEEVVVVVEAEAHRRRPARGSRCRRPYSRGSPAACAGAARRPTCASASSRTGTHAAPANAHKQSLLQISVALAVCPVHFSSVLEVAVREEISTVKRVQHKSTIKAAGQYSRS